MQAFLNSVVPQLTGADWDLVLPCWKAEVSKKGDHLNEIGQICRELRFTDDGLMRGHHLIDGKQATMFFIRRNELHTLFDRLYPQVARRVPQKILATCLGIHQPERLRRIRKRRVKPENI